jgi:hypothetical protein
VLTFDVCELYRNVKKPQAQHVAAVVSNAALTERVDIDVLVDTGSNVHITPHVDMLRNYRPVPRGCRDVQRGTHASDDVRGVSRHREAAHASKAQAKAVQCYWSPPEWRVQCALGKATCTPRERAPEERKKCCMQT